MKHNPKNYYQDKLGDEFGAVYEGLWNQWCRGWVRLSEIRTLFSDAERVELLNAATGGGFFWDVQQVFLDDLMLCLTRMTDPKGDGGKANLTVLRLPDLCKEDEDLRTDVAELVKKAVNLASRARTYRHKRISHFDLEAVLNPKQEPVPRASLDEAQAALDAIHEILNTISYRLLHEHIANEVVIQPRALAFAVRSENLANNVQFVDSLIDPTGTVKFTDLKSANAFLEKMSKPPSSQNVRQVINLRESAALFKKDGKKRRSPLWCSK